MASLSLALPTRTSHPSFLNKAVEIADMMLHYRRRTFDQYLHADATTQAQLNNVAIEFQEDDTTSKGFNQYRAVR